MSPDEYVAGPEVPDHELVKVRRSTLDRLIFQEKVRRAGRWTTNVILAASVALNGVLLWLFLDARTTAQETQCRVEISAAYDEALADVLVLSGERAGQPTPTGDELEALLDVVNRPKRIAQLRAEDDPCAVIGRLDRIP